MTKTFRILHLESRTDEAVRIRFSGTEEGTDLIEREIARGAYKLVAELQAENLDEVFARSQNIDSLWINADGIDKKITAAGARSTSVGDIIETGGETFMVDPLGFTPLGAAS